MVLALAASRWVVETPKWPVTWACLLVDSAIAMCLSFTYFTCITNTIVKSFPCLASMHLVSGLITPTLRTPLQDHLSTHKREMQHNYDYVALYSNKDPWLGTANPIDIRCKFSCDGEFIMLEEHLQGKLLPHPFLYTPSFSIYTPSLSSVPLSSFEHRFQMSMYRDRFRLWARADVPLAGWFHHSGGSSTQSIDLCPVEQSTSSRLLPHTP